MLMLFAAEHSLYYKGLRIKVKRRAEEVPAQGQTSRLACGASSSRG